MTFTFSLLHHGPGLSESKTLHGLIALAPRPLFWQPMTLTMNKVHQHTTVEGVALLPGCLSTPRCPIWCYEEKWATGEEMTMTLCVQEDSDVHSFHVWVNDRVWAHTAWSWMCLHPHMKKPITHHWTWVDSCETPPCPHHGWCCTHWCWSAPPACTASTASRCLTQIQCCPLG